MSSTVDRVVVLGLDGATWTVLDPMIERGVMPNLGALRDGSARGTLRSVVPPVTTAAWTSMMTGCLPPRHGVFDHRYYDAVEGRMKVNHSGRIRVPTLWRILSEAGRTVVCLNLPGQYPPPSVRGVVVSGMDAPHLEGALQGSQEFAQRLRAEVPGYALRYFWKRAPQSLDELETNARQTAESFRGRAEGGLLADRVYPDWSVLMVQFQNLDPFQHRVWPYLNVDDTGIERPGWNEAAALVMRGLDTAVGLLCELAERRGAAVVVVSDHGFGPCRGRIDVHRILLDSGLIRLPSWTGRLWRRGEQARDRLRVWRAKRSDPTARSSSFDQAIVAQFPFDWKRTLAFAPHQDTAAMVYVNSSARGGPHRNTAVSTPRQLDEARELAFRALAQARHPETGTPLFPLIIPVAEHYGLDPAREGYPDLIALPDEAYWVRTRFTPRGSVVSADPNLPGTHRLEGVIALRGLGLAAGCRIQARLIDVAPTLLELLGLPVPSFIEGTSILSGGATQESGQPHPRQHRVSTVHSRQDRCDGPHGPAFEIPPEEQAIIERRLAELGYLE